MEKSYNLQQLVSISLIKSEKSEMYHYVASQDAKYFFDLLIKRRISEGIYNNLSGEFQVNEEFFTKTELSKKYYITEYKQLFVKPSVFMRFSNNATFEKYFNTESEAREYKKEIENIASNGKTENFIQ